jgi:solute carrier family 13 (sodium-dependent dicarboxylate transporter), member 2/3/5
MQVGAQAQAALPRPTRTQLTGLLVGLALFTLVLAVEVPGLAPDGQRMLAIFLLAIVLWITEAVPLVATAVLVILLQVLLISSEAVVAVPGEALPASRYFATLADPVIVLFLGGFLIAQGAAKFDLDRNLAAVLLRPFAGSARARCWG